MRKQNIGLIMGGVSGEHQVSLLSAFSIFKSIDKKKYNVFIIGVDEKGLWHLGKREDCWINPGDPQKTKLNLKMPLVWPVKTRRGVFLEELGSGLRKNKIDIFFPIIHGTFGEDGTLQGMLEILGVPYVGPNVLGSSVGMDKEIMKRICLSSGLPVGDFLSFQKGDIVGENWKKAIKKLGWPIFVKPANLGSSVGISRVNNLKELKKAMTLAFSFDNKIILEKTIQGREIECSVLGNEKIEASLPGEIKLKKGFYSYEAKYLKSDLAFPTPVADLSKRRIEEIQLLAKKVFQILGCEGMARIDFFLDRKGKIWVNEINTIPGFTEISMFSKMWSESGLKYIDLLDKLIELAIKRKKRQDKLKRKL